MKAENNMPPSAPYEIEIKGEEAIITFFDRVTEVEFSEEAPRYTYDVYHMTIRNRPTLEHSLQANLHTWLAVAKDAEYKQLAATVRTKRDSLLKDTDYLVMTDYPLSDSRRQAIQSYRQALRDVPEQIGFPYDVVWPVM